MGSGVRTPATPLQKIPLLYPETLEVPVRGRVQLRILELGDGAGEKPKKKKNYYVEYLAKINLIISFKD